MSDLDELEQIEQPMFGETLRKSAKLSKRGRQYFATVRNHARSRSRLGARPRRKVRVSLAPVSLPESDE